MVSAARFVLSVALTGLLFAPWTGRAGELYSYVDEDGVMHFSNAPSDRRYRKLGKRVAAGVYRPATVEARARPLPRALAKQQYLDHIRAAAEKYRVPEALLLAVMAVESNFDHRAVSEKGAVGLMQLMPGTAKDMYVSDAYEPAQNIDGGARYLRILANMYDGDLVRTLAAYNAGPEAVRRAGGEVPNIPETREYVRKVVALYEAYKAGR
jgi:soluble lytic murein transglycosylase-like protein